MTQAQLAPKKPFPPGMPVRPGDVIAGKYSVEDLVAVGGMGVVVRAKHLSLGHQVAIKVLLPEEATDSGQAVPRFLREARAAAGIRSDHVVRIYDVDTLESGLPYMVMELLSGLDLRRVVKSRGPLPVPQAVDFVLQAAEAIGHAHALGIVHRDLKPSNLFLTERSDGQPLVKVLDFGISKASHDPLMEGTLTTTRAMMGSPMYMSPEQVRDSKSVDGRSDIWSLGVILYELLAGKHAFRGDSLPAICAAIAADTPASLRSVRSDVPLDLEAVVMRCLEKDATLRFQTVAELRRALVPFSSRDLAHAGVMPEPPSPSGAALPHASSGDVASRSRSAVRPPVGSPALSESGSASHRQIETLPSQEFERSDPNSPTVAYQEIEKPGALRAPPVGFTPSDAPFAATGVGSGPGRSRSFALGIGAVVLLLAGATVVGFSLRGAGTSAAAVPTPTAAPAISTFRLEIESHPSGAEVFEGDQVHGKTPLALEINRADVTSTPRVFRLELPGYRPYEHRQGPADGKVTIRPRLEPEPLPKEPASAEPAATPGRPRRPAPSTRETTPDNSHKPSTDIRLSR